MCGARRVATLGTLEGLGILQPLRGDRTLAFEPFFPFDVSSTEHDAVDVTRTWWLTEHEGKALCIPDVTIREV